MGRAAGAQAEPVVDVCLVVAAFGLGVAGLVAKRTDPEIEAASLDLAALVVAAAAALPLWWRRSHPLRVLGAVLLVVVLAPWLDEPPGLFSGQVGMELVVTIYAVGAWATRVHLARGISAVLLVVIVAGALHDGSGVLAASTFGLALVALPLVAGYAARARRRYLEEIKRRLEEAERDRDERARRAIQEERTRIARELHDVVAHHVSLIGVQAGAARSSLGRSPEATRAALEAIESASRDAVGEMRQLLDVLRPVDDAGVPAPQPAITALPALVERWRSAGLDIRAVTTGVEEELPPTLSLSCYRVVEEALTNIARHSPARRGEVSVVVSPSDVTISVRDPGPARPRAAATDTGRGLVGMAERVALFHGTLSAGPTPDGGFAVEARFPRPAP